MSWNNITPAKCLTPKKPIHLWLGKNRTVTCCGQISHRSSNFMASEYFRMVTCLRCKKTTVFKGKKI